MNTYWAIGVMSGTSLDGTDLALCHFTENEGRWTFEIKEAVTYPYPAEWTEHLRNAHTYDGLSLALLHTSYGHYLGSVVRKFLQQLSVRPHLIASHGHTVFHQPSARMTLQIGSGAALAAETGLPVVCDFRTTDVAKGGQGAPLVPAGDQLLFGSYFFCLNLGGFANISFQQDDKRIAGDICPVNFVLNSLAIRLGHPYDPDGDLARSGKINANLFTRLNALAFYHLQPPKSLGREWVEKNITPLFNDSGLTVHDLLRTYTEHAAFQITRVLDQDPGHPMIVTGGGAYNTFLMERIRDHTHNPVFIPDDLVIQYKEALIFAFLGVLRSRSQSNCLHSATGATEDSCGGAVYLP